MIPFAFPEDRSVARTPSRKRQGAGSSGATFAINMRRNPTSASPMRHSTEHLK